MVPLKRKGQCPFQKVPRRFETALCAAFLSAGKKLCFCLAKEQKGNQEQSSLKQSYASNLCAVKLSMLLFSNFDKP